MSFSAIPSAEEIRQIQSKRIRFGIDAFLCETAKEMDKVLESGQNQVMIYPPHHIADEVKTELQSLGYEVDIIDRDNIGDDGLKAMRISW